jgi:hypothetical protein|tara:strand:+ start:332 stop:670 length:339 start_codon:yes stop_codon:yes gene_type:complete
MNPVTDILFAVAWFGLLFFAIRSLIKGWSMMRDPQPFKGYMKGEWTTEVTKRVHPEMQDVQPGDKLLGVTFEKKTECDLEEYRALQERIEELKLELESDDEDDDEGGLVVRK